MRTLKGKRPDSKMIPRQWSTWVSMERSSCTRDDPGRGQPREWGTGNIHKMDFGMLTALEAVT